MTPASLPARHPDTEIGGIILEMMAEHQDRCIIRLSGGGYGEMCSEVITTPEAAICIVCPAELDPERCCATCGLCWTSRRTISFLRH